MKNIVVVGLGYVGLNLALIIEKSLKKHKLDFNISGFDVNKRRVESLKNNHDTYSGASYLDLESSKIKFINSIEEINRKGSNEQINFIICVSTPVYADHYPNLSHLVSASELVGKVLRKEDLVVYESTVYPGATEDICIPILEKTSNLKSKDDFYVGFSPERINPGDSLHQMANVTKLISGQNEKVLEMVYEIYKKIFPENIFKCSSIKVAESSKILENTQRDVNIALINEFSHLTEKLGISIHDVLDAANTKWNFIDVKPGFPGGECIPVDPYYYIELAERNGVTAELAKAARNINDNLFYLINKIHMGMMKVNSNKIALLGLSYKSNVPDMKNSMGIKLFSLLKRDTVHPYDIIAHDPLVDKDILKNDSGIEILELDKINNLGSIILMESDSAYVEYGIDNLINKIEKNGYFYDIPGLFYKQREQIIVAGINYWSF